MYVGGVHAESDLRVLRQLIRDNSLGLLSTVISSPNFPLIQASHIPFVLDIDETGDTNLGVLRCHLSRQNPQSKAIIEEVNLKRDSGDTTNILEQDVLVIFTSDIHHYVTPKFYTETKPTTAKVVPTWNYSAVQVYGRATVYIDSKSDDTSAFLGKQLHDLSEFHETTTMGYTGKGDKPGPWKITDAPDRFIEIMTKSIIGIEIKIERMEGKVKMSQEMRDGDVDGVIKGYRALATETGSEMASLVEQSREKKRQNKLL